MAREREHKSKSFMNPLTYIGFSLTVFSMALVALLITRGANINYFTYILFVPFLVGVALVVMGSLFFGQQEALSIKLSNARQAKESKQQSSQIQEKLTALEKQFEEIRLRSNQPEGSPLNLEALKSIFIEQIDQPFLNKVAEKIEENTGEIKFNSDIEEDFENMRDRIESEIASLSGRSNVNLFIGSIISVFGIGILTYFLVSEKGIFFSGQSPVSDGLKDYLIHFIPRISVVIFIEIFSFFFLKLYKSNLEDIKYYQNEFTNVESKILSIKCALNIGDDSLSKDILLALAGTERNRVIKKDETTVELEKFRFENNTNKNIVDVLKTVIKSTPWGKTGE